MPATKRPIVGSIFLFLFSLPFAGVGVGATVWIWHDMLRSREALNAWQEVPARVLEANLESRRGSKGGTTYLATGRFAYEFDGKTHESTQLSFDSGADNIGDYQKRLHQELSQSHKTGRPLICRVNPANPSEAVLKPELRPEMLLFKALFAVAFGGAGFAIMAGSVGGSSAATVRGGLRKKYPQEPWLWRQDWHETTLHSRLGGGAAAGAVVLVLAVLATGPLWPLLGGAWSGGGAFSLLLSGFLLILLAVAGFCAWCILHWWKFRGTRLELASSPLFLGSPLKADLFLPKGIPAGAKLDFQLACVHRVVTGRGKHSKTTTTEKWSHQVSLPGPFLPGQPISFSCDLPADAHSTDLLNSNDTHTWKLSAKADIPGVDLSVEFEVPVFAAPASPLG